MPISASKTMNSDDTFHRDVFNHVCIRKRAIQLKRHNQCQSECVQWLIQWTQTHQRFLTQLEFE